MRLLLIFCNQNLLMFHALNTQLLVSLQEKHQICICSNYKNKTKWHNHEFVSQELIEVYSCYPFISSYILEVKVNECEEGFHASY